MPITEIEVHPLSQSRWKDLTVLSESRGGPHYCWCNLYRFSNAASFNKPEKKLNLKQLVFESVPVGVLAYDGDRPIGWCSVGPRETY